MPIDGVELSISPENLQPSLKYNQALVMKRDMFRRISRLMEIVGMRLWSVTSTRVWVITAQETVSCRCLIIGDAVHDTKESLCL